LTSSASTLTPTLTVSAGALLGNGTVGYALVNSGGTLIPGDSISLAGELSVTETLTQNVGGTLEIAIGGTTVGGQYDQLDITGSATLDGTLDINLINSFVPTVGETFDIVNASSVACGWTVNGVVINSSEYFAESCSGSEVVLTVDSGTPPAIRNGSDGAPQPDVLGTPEPGGVVLFGTALLALSWILRRSLARGDERIR